MSRLALSICTLLALTSGCGSSSVCRTTCDYYVECTLEQLDDAGVECEWDDPDEARDACREICDDELDKLDGEDREQVEDCVHCMYDDLEGSCDFGDYVDALDDCDDFCDDNDVEDFFGEFGEEWTDEAEDALECDF